VQVIQLEDYTFAPSCIAAPSGSHLTLQNTGSVPHTFTVRDTPIDQSVDAGAGAEVTLAGLTAGTYPVVCKIHPQMTATLVVS
jgi:plastocyanin